MLWPNGSRTKPNVSSPFGPREVTQAGASSNHLGCDFTGFDTVRAIADGAVVWVGWRDGWSGGGYMVWIQHTGFLSRSLHMVDGSARVSIGDRVSEGQTIGSMGNTARPNPVGKHLHLEVVVNGAQINPEPFIAARLSAGGNAASASSAAPAAPIQEEDDMLALRIKAGPQTHLCTLGTGVFRHLIRADDPERVKNIVRSDDAWTDIDITELPVYLQTYGCDLNIWDTRDNNGVSVTAKQAHNFVVLDPRTGKATQGGMWSAVNARAAEMRAAIAAR